MITTGIFPDAFKDNRLLFQLLKFVQKSILCAKLTTCEKKIVQNFVQIDLQPCQFHRPRQCHRY